MLLSGCSQVAARSQQGHHSAGSWALQAASLGYTKLFCLLGIVCRSGEVCSKAATAFRCSARLSAHAGRGHGAELYIRNTQHVNCSRPCM